MLDARKYHPGYYPVGNEYHKWTEKDHIEQAPVWCSVDLRDGNQSLVIPMNLQEKLEFYRLLVKTGFREIEAVFPAASETEYEFLRTLITQKLTPSAPARAIHSLPVSAARPSASPLEPRRWIIFRITTRIL